MVEVTLERQLSEIWQSQKFYPAGLVTEDGKNVTVLYPGRLNDGRGGDFCGAVVVVDGQKLSGDIELHVKSGDWIGHGHHKDAAYNSVVLHVVWRNTGGTTMLQNGAFVPILALKECIPAEVYKPAALAQVRPCDNTRIHLSIGTLTNILDETGDARFKANARKFQQEIFTESPGQVLYSGIMTALGYSKNKTPFRELARRLPLDLVQKTILYHDESPENIYVRLNRLMLHIAGLAPVKTGNSRMESTSESSDFLSSIQPMSAGDWDFFKVRPSNSPFTRITSASRLLIRYRETGFLEGLINLVRHTPSVRADAYLQAGLVVTGIGRTRVDEIIVNVLLPFALAFGQGNDEPYLADLAFSLYRDYKRLASNCLEKHMTEQLDLPHRIVNTARRQQGLLHIYKTMCIQAECDVCSLAQT